MSASQTRRSAGVLARLAARLFEKNRVPAAAGRPFVPVHVSAAGLQPGQPRTSALTLRHPFYEADVQGEAPQLHTDDNWPTTSKDDSDQFGAPGRSSGRSRLPSTALPPRASPPGGKPAVFVWTSCLPRDCFPCLVFVSHFWGALHSRSSSFPFGSLVMQVYRPDVPAISVQIGETEPGPASCQIE